MSREKGSTELGKNTLSIMEGNQQDIQVRSKEKVIVGGRDVHEFSTRIIQLGVFNIIGNISLSPRGIPAAIAAIVMALLIAAYFIESKPSQEKVDLPKNIELRLSEIVLDSAKSLEAGYQTNLMQSESISQGKMPLGVFFLEAFTHLLPFDLANNSSAAHPSKLSGLNFPFSNNPPARELPQFGDSGKGDLNTKVSVATPKLLPTSTPRSSPISTPTPSLDFATSIDNEALSFEPQKVPEPSNFVGLLIVLLLFSVFKSKRK